MVKRQGMTMNHPRTILLVKRRVCPWPPRASLGFPPKRALGSEGGHPSTLLQVCAFSLGLIIRLAVTFLPVSLGYGEDPNSRPSAPVVETGTTPSSSRTRRTARADMDDGSADTSNGTKTRSRKRSKKKGSLSSAG